MVSEMVVFDDFPMEIDGFGNVCNLLQPKMFWGNDVAEFPGGLCRPISAKHVWPKTCEHVLFFKVVFAFHAI